MSTDEIRKTKIDIKLSRISGILSNFSNIGPKEQLPLIMFSFNEVKTTSQIQE